MGLGRRVVASNDKSASCEKSDAPLSIRYQQGIIERLNWIRHTQSSKLLEATHVIARTILRGNTVWAAWDMGHNRFDVIPDRPGDPQLVTFGYDSAKARAGDCFIGHKGPGKELRNKGIIVIGGPAAWGGDAGRADLVTSDVAEDRLRPYADIWIENRITTLGGIMNIPGMPAPMGPVSGILGIVTFWMMTADAARLLARDGHTINVGGDEPALKTDFPRVGTDAPLMGTYYDTVLNRLEMIFAELGAIREIARMAADTALGDGTVWTYSRYRQSLAVEGDTRRGGLALTHGVAVTNDRLWSIRTEQGTPFPGKRGDMVIMGLFQPDHPIDLASLDSFRALNMRVVSFGPIARNGRIPNGRSVPKETDVHVGRMSDTYGLFALPGVDRHVCPTSGATQMQSFWVLCMEIVEEIMRRTDGDVPGVFLSGAIKGGMDHLYRIRTSEEERGF